MKKTVINVIVLMQLVLSIFDFGVQSVKAGEIINTENIEYRNNNDPVMQYQKTEYKRNIESFVKISPKRISRLLGKKIIYVFWGKASCPYCRAFAPGLAKLSKKQKKIFITLIQKKRIAIIL